MTLKEYKEAMQAADYREKYAFASGTAATCNGQWRKVL